MNSWEKVGLGVLVVLGVMQPLMCERKKGAGDIRGPTDVKTERVARSPQGDCGARRAPRLAQATYSDAAPSAALDRGCLGANQVALASLKLNWGALDLMGLAGAS
jgi:hypothetical protein